MPERTEALKRAQKNYIEKFSRVEIRMTPERRDQIKAHSKTRGESVNAFINRAVDETIKRDKAAQGAK